MLAAKMVVRKVECLVDNWDSKKAEQKADEKVQRKVDKWVSGLVDRKDCELVVMRVGLLVDKRGDLLVVSLAAELADLLAVYSVVQLVAYG